MSIHTLPPHTHTHSLISPTQPTHHTHHPTHTTYTLTPPIRYTPLIHSPLTSPIFEYSVVGIYICSDIAPLRKHVMCGCGCRRGCRWVGVGEMSDECAEGAAA